MSDELDDELQSIDEFSELPKQLPNANATLALGIISIATCWIYAVPGIVCGIIAIVLGNKDKAVYETDPAAYANSYKNSQAGKICGIIGLSLSGLFLLYVIFVLAVIGTMGGGSNIWLR